MRLGFVPIYVVNIRCCNWPYEIVGACWDQRWVADQQNIFDFSRFRLARSFFSEDALDRIYRTNPFTIKIYQVSPGYGDLKMSVTSHCIRWPNSESQFVFVSWFVRHYHNSRVETGPCTILNCFLLGSWSLHGLFACLRWFWSERFLISVCTTFFRLNPRPEFIPGGDQTHDAFDY